MNCYQFVLLQGILILSTEQQQQVISLKDDSKYSNNGINKNFLLPREQALTFLKRSRRWTDLKRFEYECVEELCSNEELKEMGHSYGKQSFTRLGRYASHFYCNNHVYEKNSKRYPTSYQCDGDNDCGNSYDEKYCRLDKKYKKKSYTNYEIRKGTSLRGGKTSYEGNVYLFGKPICDDNWDANDAKVVCRSLGFSSDTLGIPTTSSYFGDTSSDFILDDVNCRGHEDNLGVCYDYVTHDNCGASEAAGVKCIDPNAVELKGGKSHDFGNVFISGKPVCDDNWGDDEAKVICNTLGYSSKTIAIGKTLNQWNSGTSEFILDDIDCKGNERHVLECKYSTTNNCSPNEIAGVVCFDPKSMKIRKDGLIMVMDDAAVLGLFGKYESQVACNQKYGQDFESGFVPVYQITYENDTVPSYIKVLTALSNLKCKGNEIGIHKCKYTLSTISPGTKVYIPLLFCAKCNQNYFMNLLKNLSFDHDLKTQLQKVRGALGNLKRDCYPWKCQGGSNNKYNDYCKVYNFLKEFEALVSTFKNHSNIFVLNRKIDYVARLQHQYLKETFSDIINKIGDVYSRVTNSQKNLANYFQKLAKFENDKINIDIKILLKSITANIKSLKESFGLFKTQIKELGEFASTTNLRDKIELSLDVILQTTSILFTNYLTDTASLADKAIALRQASVAVANANAKSKTIDNILEKLLPKIKTIIENIQLKLKLNKKKYEVLNNFFKELIANTFTSKDSITFLEIYQNFEPAIDKAQISEFDETLSYVTENLCSIIKDTSSVSGAEISKIESSNGLCYNVKISVRKIMVMFEEISDDEDGLIKSLANLAKAKIKQNGANELYNTLKKTTSSKIGNLILKYKSYVILQEQKRNLIAQSCQYITYINHGSEEPFCQKLINNPNLHIINDLISYKINADMCSTQVIDNPLLVSIPTFSSKYSNSNESLSKIDGEIDLNGFLKRSNSSHKINGNITFQIPNINWLQKNGWVLDSKVKGPIFLKKFELFLPPATTKYKYSVETDLIMIKNKLHNVNYIFTDVPHSKCHYVENDNNINCKDMVTPYHTGNCGSKISPVCINSPGDFKGPIYPLATASWKLIIRSKALLNEIYSATKFYLKARVQLCYKSSSSSYKSSKLKDTLYKKIPSSSRPKRSLSCCSKANQYYDQKILIQSNGINHCKFCPKNSKPRLNGFFCEKCPPGFIPMQDQLYGCQKSK